LPATFEMAFDGSRDDLLKRMDWMYQLDFS